MLLKRAEKGKPTPALELRPTLSSDELLPWELFAQLHSQRGKLSVIAPMPGGGLSVMMEPDMIKMADIKAALEIHQLYGEVALETLNLIQILDETYIAWEHKHGKKKLQKDGKGK